MVTVIWIISSKAWKLPPKDPKLTKFVVVPSVMDKDYIVKDVPLDTKLTKKRLSGQVYSSVCSVQLTEQKF